MTKKHFKVLAENLKAQRPQPHWCANKRLQWEMDVKAIAKVCEEQNSRFELQPLY